MSSTEDHFLSFTKNVTLSVSIPGVALSVLLLGAIAYLQWNPISRPHLDRVSFRLLVYALVANVIFGSMVFFLTVKKTSTACGVFAFLGMTSPTFSACMFCCMALNLQLVLVYGVSGNKMEKFYVFGAVFLSGACNIPTWAAREAGWDATSSTCWPRDPTPTEQLHWLLGTYSVPMLLMATVELVSFVNILIFMLRHEKRVQRLRAEALSQDISVSESGIVTLASSLPKHPIVQFRSIIIRIALYPLFSCFLSTTACILDVHNVLHPDPTNLNMNLRIANLCIYSFRPLLYVLLSGTDPSLIRAVRSLRPKSCPQCPQPPRSPTQIATTDPHELALTELAQKYSRTGDTEKKTSSAEYNRRRHLTAEEGLAEEELRSERVSRQL